MHPFWKGIRGARWVDTLAFLSNKALYGLSRRLGITPKWHWIHFPFDLTRRTYYIPYLKAHVDGGGLLRGLLHAENPDFPKEWLHKLHAGTYGIEVGSHRGYWLLLHAHHLSPQAQVIAIEPLSSNFQFLTANFYRNRFFSVVALQLAVGESPDLLSMKVDDSPFGIIGNARLQNVSDASAYRVWVVRLNDLVELLKLPALDWVKLDIEGAEVQALRGATQVLQRYRPHLWIEVHGTFAQLYPILQVHDYLLAGEKWYAKTREDMGHIWAVPKEEIDTGRLASGQHR